MYWETTDRICGIFSLFRFLVYICFNAQKLIRENEKYSGNRKGGQNYDRFVFPRFIEKMRVSRAF